MSAQMLAQKVLLRVNAGVRGHLEHRAAMGAAQTGSGLAPVAVGQATRLPSLIGRLARCSGESPEQTQADESSAPLFRRTALLAAQPADEEIEFARGEAAALAEGGHAVVVLAVEALVAGVFQEFGEPFV